MNLYIRYKDGVIYDHPVLEDNLRTAFPDFDANNNPHDYVPFDRSDKPVIDDWLVITGFHYELNNGRVYDVWDTRFMTQQEAEIQRQAMLDECVRAATFYINNIDTIHEARDLTPEQRQEFLDKLVDLRDNPVLYPKFCCSGCMADDTGQQAPDRYGWNN
jgi:hypothetical protein